MFWKWLNWQIEVSCEKFVNSETEYYLNVKAGFCIPVSTRISENESKN